MNISREHGWIQRAILTELDALEPGEPLSISNDWSSGRRAAKSLAERKAALGAFDAHSGPLVPHR